LEGDFFFSFSVQHSRWGFGAENGELKDLNESAESCSC